MDAAIKKLQELKLELGEHQKVRRCLEVAPSPTNLAAAHRRCQCCITMLQADGLKLEAQLGR